MTGLVIGVCAGMAAGLAVEIIKRRSVIVMQVGGMGGLAAGALFETVRLWWSQRRYRLTREKPSNLGTFQR